MRECRFLILVIGLLVLSVAISSAQEASPDWLKVTVDAGWRARDSSGELVYKDKL